MDGKQLLSEILSFYKYKVDNNLCTPAEIEAASKVLQENMEIYGTIDDFARFYGKSKDAVNGVIKRRMIENQSAMLSCTASAPSKRYSHQIGAKQTDIQA